MKKGLFCVVICVLFCAVQSVAQTHAFKGIVCTEGRAPLPGATVLVLNGGGDAKVQGVSCDEQGRFEMKLPGGQYRIEYSFIGYEKQVVAYRFAADLQADTVFLKSKIYAMDTVVVKSQQVTYKHNGYVVNVGQNSIYKGLQLDDVLQMAPGIWADKETLMAYGKDVSKVYVNDREVRLNGEVLMQYLGTFSSETIQSIEVVIGSGVEDDASAMGQRILKITTRRSELSGVQGTVSTRISFSEGFFTVAPQLNLNLRQNKFSSYIIGGYGFTRSDFASQTENTFYDSSTSSLASANSTSETTRGNATVGLGYDFNPKNLLTLEFFWSKSASDDDSWVNTTFDDPQSAIPPVEDRGATHNTNQSSNTSLNYIWKPRENTKLIFKADWLHSGSDLNTKNYITNGDFSQSLNESDLTRNVYTAGADFTRTFGDDELMAGVKYSNTFSDIRSIYSKLYDQSWVIDDRFTDDYLYKEQISALYAKYVLKRGRFNLSAGVRGEHSAIDPQSRTHPQGSVPTDYFDLFPEAGVGYIAGSKQDNQFSLQFSRSVSRPSFRELNPYIIPVSYTSYGIGNPYLKPTYDYNLEFVSTLKNKYVLTCSWTRGLGSIDLITFADPSSDIVYLQYQNIGFREKWETYVRIPITIFEWWKLELSGAYAYTVQEQLGVKGYNHNLFGLFQSTMKLPGNFTILCSGIAMTPLLIGYSKQFKDPSVNCSITKSFFTNKFIIQFKAEDILNANGRLRLETRTPDFNQVYRHNTIFRKFTLNLTYNFRSGKSASVRRVEAGNQEERRRAGE